MFQAGGILGIIVIGWEMDRFKAHKVLIGTLSGAALVTLAIARLDLNLYGLMTLVFLLEYCINSTNTSWTTMSANYYPTRIRFTGDQLDDGRRAVRRGVRRVWRQSAAGLEMEPGAIVHPADRSDLHRCGGGLAKKPQRSIEHDRGDALS
ncbi:hypothetical protein [Pseudomonas fluorescens]|uniref:hypothetical protein n=1 Tax=Pseudomonas fluorescens TaxID=294 RepID=UPI001783EE9E|nr:hypothetical protein [Pseudomonas fluorescens]